MEFAYYPGQEAEKIGQEIVEREREFERLRPCTLHFLFCDPAPVRDGKQLYGTVEKVGGKNAFAWWQAKGEEKSDPFFRLTLSDALWAKLDAEQQVWLVRHFLRRCGVKTRKGKRKLHLIRPEIELFLRDLRDRCMDEVCNVWSAIETQQRQPSLVFEPEGDGDEERWRG